MLMIECEKVFAKAFPFWDKLTSNDRRILCDSSMDAVYSKGMNIHGGSSECTGAILVKRGCLRAYILSEEGREITLYRLYPGEICTLSASCILKSITFDVFIDSETDSECYVIDGSTFAEISSHNIYVKNFVLETAVGRFSDVMWALQQVLFMRLDKRLAIFLWDEMQKKGDTTINLTHEQIAKYMGSAREVVSRMLKYFSSEGIVALSRGGIKICDKQKLKKLAMN